MNFHETLYTLVTFAQYTVVYMCTFCFCSVTTNKSVLVLHLQYITLYYFITEKKFKVRYYIFLLMTKLCS